MSGSSASNFKDELSTLACIKYSQMTNKGAVVGIHKHQSGLFVDELATPILFKYGTFKKPKIVKEEQESEDED